MTALKPIENRRVRSVASERYPLNKKCAHPKCPDDAVDPHHAFPRSAIGGDSWFVEILTDTLPDQSEGRKEVITSTVVIPHVTGLCRFHHEAVEEHLAWIKLEDGVWNWYDRNGNMHAEEEWHLLGPLNPQPGSAEGKKKRKKFQGEARRKRKVISIRVPDDADENGAALFDEAIYNLETRIQGERERRPSYFTIMAALDWTLLNSDETDFSE